MSPYRVGAFHGRSPWQSTGDAKANRRLPLRSSASFMRSRWTARPPYKVVRSAKVHEAFG